MAIDGPMTLDTVLHGPLCGPRLLTKRLAKDSRGTAVTQGYAADRTAEQLQDPAQRAADRIDELRRIPESSE